MDLTPPPPQADEDPPYEPPTKTISKCSDKATTKKKRAMSSKVAKKKDSECDSENEKETVDTPKDTKSRLKTTAPGKTSKKKAVSKSKSSVKKSVKPKDEEPEEIKRLYSKLKTGYFVCVACSDKFTHRYKVRAHIRLKHQPRQTFQCPECPLIYKSKYQLKIHRNTHLENKSDFMFFCDKCDYRALSKNNLKHHEIRKHSNDYPFECDHCKKRFKVKMDLKFHLGTHSDSQHMCDICGKMYSSPESLYKHRRVIHLNEYKFKCPKCWQKLLSQESLDHHLEKHKVLHSCDECDLKFTKKNYVTRHKKRVHMVEKNKLCPVCGKSFVCMATLRVHYLTHAKVKPYMCNVCGLSFTQRSSMMLHWKRKHPDAEAPPPPVILTNFFDSINAEVQKLAVPVMESSSNDASSNVATGASCQITETASSSNTINSTF